MTLNELISSPRDDSFMQEWLKESDNRTTVLTHHHEKETASQKAVFIRLFQNAIGAVWTVTPEARDYANTVYGRGSRGSTGGDYFAEID